MKSPSFRPVVEELESRRLLAGNVTASVFQGKLILTGDTENNQVEISRPQGGILRVTGQAGTTINGGAMQDFRNVVGNVVAKFKAGDDSMTVNTVELAAGLVFKGGSGNNSMTMFSTRAGRNVRYVGGPNNDSLTILTSFIAGNALCDFREGSTNQTLIMTTSSIFGSLVFQSQGDIIDALLFTGLTVHGPTTLSLSAGNDSLAADDCLFLGPVVATTGAGNDNVGLDNGLVGPGQTIFASRLDLKTGAGDDNVQLGAFVDPSRQVVFRARATFNGGSGINTLNDNNSIKDDPAKFSVVNFV